MPHVENWHTGLLIMIPIWRTFLKRNLRRIFLLADAAFLVLLLACYSNYSYLLKNTWYLFSSSLAHRLQTNAFLEGRLSLSHYPFGLPLDYIWTGKAMYQNWGLGVPLLRLPFEWGARLCGHFGFPDRLILAFYLLVMLAVLNSATKRILGVMGIGGCWGLGFLIRWFILAWVLFAPGMTELLKTRFTCYDETVFYGCLYAYVLLSLLWIFMHRQSNRLLFGICLASGLAWLIRPTLIFYGLSTACLAVVLSYLQDRNLRLVLWSSVFFALGVLMEAVFNYLRFGSCLEFGYAATVNGWPFTEYPLRFSNPVKLAHLATVVKELAGALFFNFSWPSHLNRKIENYCVVFNYVQLWIMIAGAGCFSIFVFLERSKLFSGVRQAIPLRVIVYTLFWGIANFGFLFLFYLYLPTLTSRYMIEFSIAINAVFFALIFLVVLLIFQLRRRIGIFLICYFFLLTAIYYLKHDYFLDGKRQLISAVTQKEAQRLVADFNKNTSARPFMPDTLYCGSKVSVDGLRFQSSGWRMTGDCQVGVLTDIFLPAKRCLSFNFSLLNNFSNAEILVKRDFTFLKMSPTQVIKSPSIKDLSFTETFCSELQENSGISLYSIAWVSGEHFTQDKLPVKLNWVSSLDH
ncbi:MAG: hypothetical protein HQL22_08345 [Candidatus Omnitrophica bacterium]|nr:hypothetical protein [Candidatus Omnitrophota bacterium]